MELQCTSGCLHNIYRILRHGVNVNCFDPSFQSGPYLNDYVNSDWVRSAITHCIHTPPLYTNALLTARISAYTRKLHHLLNILYCN